MITKQELINVVLDILTQDQMKELIARLQAVDAKSNKTEDTGPVYEEPPAMSKRIVNDDFTVNRDDKEDRKSVPVQASSNTWVDAGEERKEETQIKKAPMPRVRKKVEMIKVNCSVCHQPKEISPGLMTSSRAYYRCENCVGGGR